MTSTRSVNNDSASHLPAYSHLLPLTDIEEEHDKILLIEFTDTVVYPVT